MVYQGISHMWLTFTKNFSSSHMAHTWCGEISCLDRSVDEWDSETGWSSTQTPHRLKWYWRRNFLKMFHKYIERTCCTLSIFIVYFFQPFWINQRRFVLSFWPSISQTHDDGHSSKPVAIPTVRHKNQSPNN